MYSQFEIFSDPLHYDMWCLRHKGDRDFNMTLHFNTKDHAEHARAVVQKWMKDELEDCAKDAEWCFDNYLEHLVPERIRSRGGND